jgi:hypothetical protein
MLAALPAVVERVVVQLLPLPGQVPNLMPHQKKPNALSGGYFDTTMRAFRVPSASSTGFYSRAEMRRWDEGVRAVNATIAAAARRAFAATPDRLVLFDVPARLARHDAKHRNGDAVIVTDAAGTRRFTNHGFAGYRGGVEGSVGGLGSLDNHHPSTLGYRLFAAELGAALNASLPDTVLPERLPVTDAGDTLLADPPPLAMRLLALLYAVTTEPPAAQAGGAEAPFPPTPALESLSGVMERSATAGFARIMAAPARE